MTDFTNADLLTALITPFNEQGEVDYPDIKEL